MGTFVMGRQLHYIQSLNPGYHRENVAMIPIHKMDLSLVRGELLDLPGVSGISAADSEIYNIQHYSGTEWEGKDPNEIFLSVNFLVESNFINTMGLKLLEGSDYTGTEADKDGYIINETAAQMMGFDDPIGMRIKLFGHLDGVIIGIVNDFHHDNMRKKINPLIMYCNSEHTYRYFYARIESGKTRMALDNIEKLWKRYNAGYQFTYNFVDESFDKMHRADLRTGMLFNIFAFIAIMISCLGLFGLVTFTAESKTKEIGIRKVLGARISSIVVMLSREFLILVVIAMLVAFPLAFWLLNSMLEDFAYRISISWWMFAVAALMVIVLTMFTVGFQAIKAAMANPVKAIMSE
jgi:ABC-type antimicrobial peptide transport system permease subunit